MDILIFTCLNIRAVHIELLLPDMMVHNFVLAFQRFCNLYIISGCLYSDNTKTSKGGEIIKQALQSSKFGEELRSNNMSHIQIPLYAAVISSAWERFLKVVKSCLYKVIGRDKLTYFELFSPIFKM